MTLRALLTRVLEFYESYNAQKPTPTGIFILVISDSYVIEH